MEAVIGAVYLDAGYAATEEMVLRLLSERLSGAAKGPGEEDYKTRLQELCAQTYDELPVYRVTDSGPDHAKVFAAEVWSAVGHGAGARDAPKSRQSRWPHETRGLPSRPAPGTGERREMAKGPGRVAGRFRRAWSCHGG